MLLILDTYLGFALVAGPWNYVHFKRQRRLPMLLVEEVDS